MMPTFVVLIQKNEYIIEQPAPAATFWTVSVALALTVYGLGCLLAVLLINSGLLNVAQGGYLALWPMCIGLGIAVGTLLLDWEVWS